MKQLSIIIVYFMRALSASAQVTFEHFHDPGAEPTMIRLSLGGDKYLMFDGNTQILIFNMDHTIYRDIAVPQYPGYTVSGFPICISDRLFNSDNLIEFGVFYYGNTSKFEVINENGVVLNSVPGYDSPQLFRDPTGHFKLMIAESNNKESVYSLPGSIPCVDRCGTTSSN